MTCYGDAKGPEDPHERLLGECTSEGSCFPNTQGLPCPITLSGQPGWTPLPHSSRCSPAPWLPALRIMASRTLLLEPSEGPLLFRKQKLTAKHTAPIRKVIYGTDN